MRALFFFHSGFTHTCAHTHANTDSFFAMNCSKRVHKRFLWVVRGVKHTDNLILSLSTGKKKKNSFNSVQTYEFTFLLATHRGVKCYCSTSLHYTIL